MAHAAFVERRLGSLEPGKLADLVVLAAGPADTDPDAFAGLPVDLTIVGGSVVSARPPARPWPHTNTGSRTSTAVRGVELRDRGLQ